MGDEGDCVKSFGRGRGRVRRRRRSDPHEMAKVPRVSLFGNNSPYEPVNGGPPTVWGQWNRTLGELEHPERVEHQERKRVEKLELYTGTGKINFVRGDGNSTIYQDHNGHFHDVQDQEEPQVNETETVHQEIQGIVSAVDKDAVDMGGQVEPRVGRQGEKRKGSRAPRADISKKLRVTQDKPAMAVMNDLCPNLEYSYEDTRVHVRAEPRFLCRVVYPPGPEGKEYIGDARNKKAAKQDACEQILRDLGAVFDFGGDSNQNLCPPEPGDPYPVPRMAGPLQHEFPGQEMITQSMTSPGPAPIPDPSPIPTPLDSFTHPDPQAIEAYARLKNFRNDPLIQPFRQQLNIAESQPEIDFTSDDYETEAQTSCTIHHYQLPPLPNLDVSRLKNIKDIGTNTLSALNTILIPDCPTFELVGEEGPPHDRKFEVVLHLPKFGLTFHGLGGSKKAAKYHAAKQALIALIGPHLYQMFTNPSLFGPSPSPGVQPEGQPGPGPGPVKDDIPEELKPYIHLNEDEHGEYNMVFSDYICRIVNDKYDEIMQDFSDYLPQKVLAGVVMTRTVPMFENGQVIAVTTGTKCVEGGFLSTDGMAIQDCHAEILATRCLRDFLYAELEDLIYASTDEDVEQSILEAVKTREGEVKYKVKDTVRFHLYISTSPCGDARIFSPKGLETEEEKEALGDLKDDNPTRKNRGLLRAKVEAGEGTIPVENLISGPQTFDSIVQGNALYTMSCSDKLCRFNVVGIQGALLSNFLIPIYYSSIILGSLHHPVHFYRAMFSRILPLAGNIPQPFKINKAQLLMVTHEEKRKVKKSPNHAICWTAGWSTPEILAAVKGRCESGNMVSRLAKRTVFIRFLKLYKNKAGRREFNDLSYKEAKSYAGVYQETNDNFRQFMKDSNYGRWISKPLEVDSFHAI